jgi:hypothetical protein
MDSGGNITLNGVKVDIVGSSHIGLESDRIDVN